DALRDLAHADHIAGLQRIARALWHVVQHPVVTGFAALAERENAFDLYAASVSFRTISAGHADDVRNRLRGLELVRGGAHDSSGDPHASAARRHEYDITRLEAPVIRAVTTEQVIVEV